MFSGISILPIHVTLNEILPRVVAAIYLRFFSKAFRGFVADIESIHLLAWFSRGALLLVGLSSGNLVSSEVYWATLMTGIGIIIVLRRAERGKVM